ncbi:universal stress protein [Streptomyces sp. NPDC002467]|uniref:universal stress protein n=1 Tax=Streptomyces sp. NPDC002467 TaxID=3364647 RepID=UPI00369A61AB
MRRVLVGVTGTAGNLAALHRAAAEARVRGADLWAVLAWQSPGGELGSRNGLGPHALAQCRAAAAERLREVLDTAFGAVKAGVTLDGITVRGTPGAALVDVARDRPGPACGPGCGERPRLTMRPGGAGHRRPAPLRRRFIHAGCVERS